MAGKELAKMIRGTDVKGQRLNEAEDAGGFGEDSPAKKVKVSCTKPPPVDGTDGFKAAWSDGVSEINLLFSKYSEVLRERTAVDASQIQQLTDILNEALSLESQLKEKKEHLRQALTVISEKLQG